jgi:RimJ/RimL family protein N-acetyltransferase
VSVQDLVRGKLDRIREELERDGLDRTTRALRVAELALIASRMAPAVAIIHERFYELTSPPPQFRGLRDLTVRLAGPSDAEALAAIDATRPLVDERFARGDLVYVGELDGRILAHTWFHRGPEPFVEDSALLARWALAPDTFWSYGAFALPEARLSGVFVKVFQSALRELFTERGAARVQCRVKVANARSITLHERTGFRPMGTMTAFAVPGARLLSWQGDGFTRRWVARRRDVTVMALPPRPRV